jgi:hypothetical protein
MEYRTMKVLESLIPKTLQSPTAQNAITNDENVGYILLKFRRFLTYYNMGILPEFLTIKTIKSVSLEV